MEGRILAQGIKLHRCAPPGSWTRWRKKLKVNTLWQCEICDTIYKLIFDPCFETVVWIVKPEKPLLPPKGPSGVSSQDC